jgi:hypothetical protein
MKKAKRFLFGYLSKTRPARKCHEGSNNKKGCASFQSFLNALFHRPRSKFDSTIYPRTHSYLYF